MAFMKMKYGKGTVDVSVPDENLLGIIDINSNNKEINEEKVIKNALNNPIGSKPLKEIVKRGEKVCIVISDITRAFQKMSTYLPFIVEELKSGGVKDEDIYFLSASGTHRKQTEAEHKILLGEKLYGKYKIFDHQCNDSENMANLGVTSYGTPVKINKLAVECDRLIITGAIIYHLLAGWSGGRKAILPGIASFETIMHNHSMSLQGSLGDGSNPFVRCANIQDNPVHLDMLEAADIVKPDFMFNVITGSKGEIAAAVAGDYRKAHDEGRKIVDMLDCVPIEKKAELVIASAGGFPKDINFYQSIKTIVNANEAVQPGGTMIIVSECSEGLGGDQGVHDILLNFENTLEREKELRENYTISKFTGYYTCDIADKFNLIFVSSIDPSFVRNTNIKVVKTVEEALDITYKKYGSKISTYLMPKGGTTLPKLAK